MLNWTTNGPKLTESEVIRRRVAGERLPLVVRPHQGMGDHIICNGMYRVLARDWNLTLLVEPRYLEAVRLMLKDVPGIGFLAMPESQMERRCQMERDKVVLRLGFYAGTFDRWQFDREFYRQAHVPFECRWSECKLPDVPQRPKPAGEYWFVHDRPEMMNARLNLNGPVVKPDPGFSVFAHRDIILGASQIHCVSSVFAAFADCYDLGGKQLHFYPFGREIPAKNPKNQWTLHQ